VTGGKGPISGGSTPITLGRAGNVFYALFSAARSGEEEVVKQQSRSGVSSGWSETEVVATEAWLAGETVGGTDVRLPLDERAATRYTGRLLFDRFALTAACLGHRLTPLLGNPFDRDRILP
jgi:hypothetical protein